MLRPQVLEAVFVAGSVFVGMTGSAIQWEKIVTVSQREVNFGYRFISSAAGRTMTFFPSSRMNYGPTGVDLWHASFTRR